MIVPALAAVLLAATSTDTVLENGLRVVLIPHRANPMVASAVVVGAGVVHETAESSGSSHFLEHLLFNGTTTRTQRELYDAVDRIGAYNNATTREDHTLFTLLVARARAEEGLAIQADMLFRSTLPPDSFEKERKIVLEELARDRSDPSYAAAESMRASCYAGTPIARPVLGSESSLSAISRESVLVYYRTRYVPSNMTLVVMGDFEPPAMLDAVRRTFGGARRAKPLPPARGRWPATPQDNVEVVAAGDEEGAVAAAFPFEVDPWDRVAAAAEILLAAASQGEDSPLQRARQARELSGTARVALERRARPWSTVVFESEDSSTEAALDAFAEAIRSTRRGGAARERLDRALARARADAALARDQIHYFALLRGERVLHAPPGALAAEGELLRSLGPADWDAASDLLERGLSGVRVLARTGAVPAGRRSWKPGPAGREEGTVETLRSGTLANGLRFVARRSDDSDVVAVHLAAVPRSADEPPGMDGVTDLLHRVLLRGSAVHPAPSLADRWDQLGARVRGVDDPSVPFDDYYTTPEFSWIRLEVGSGTWREALAVLGEVVRFPDLTPGALEGARDEMLALSARRSKSPRETALARLDAILAPGSAWARPPGGTAETLRAISLETLRLRHGTYAQGSRLRMSIVGPIDVAAAAEGIEAAFGRLPSGTSHPETPAAGPVSPQRVDVELGAPQGYLALGAILEHAPAERAALTIAVAALSDRLSFDLRERRGLAYQVGASLRRWGGTTRFDVGMGTRPDQLQEAEAGIREVMASFRASPPDREEIERTVQAVRGRALMRRMTRISLAYEAAMEMLRGEAPGDERRALDALGAVTPEHVRAVVERHLDPGRLAVVVVR